MPVSGRYPIVLNTGRLRDQWHTMTRTGAVPRLMAHAPVPVIALAASDAAANGLVDGDFAQIRSAQGTAVRRSRRRRSRRRALPSSPCIGASSSPAQATAGVLVNPIPIPGPASRS